MKHQLFTMQLLIVNNIIILFPFTLKFCNGMLYNILYMYNNTTSEYNRRSLDDGSIHFYIAWWWVDNKQVPYIRVESNVNTLKILLLSR